jgi:hypothetical protein
MFAASSDSAPYIVGVKRGWLLLEGEANTVRPEIHFDVLQVGSPTIRGAAYERISRPSNEPDERHSSM